MADGRFLSKTIAHDLELSSVSLTADWVFMRCIPHLDREGRMPGNPTVVRAMICPLRSDITPDDVGLALAELQQADLIRWYHVDSRMAVSFPGFAENQKGMRKDREAESKHPPPDDSNAEPVSFFVDSPEDSRNVAELSREVAEDSRQVKGSEVKGSQGKLSPPSSLRSEDEGLSPPGVVENCRDRYSKDELKRLRGEACAIIRKHWWQNRKPPNWTMGQECTVWDQLTEHFDPVEFNGAIELAPRVLQFGRNGWTLKLFRSKDTGWPKIHRCIAEWQKREAARAEKGPQSTGTILNKIMTRAEAA